MDLDCGVCIYIKYGQVNKAVTIIKGWAVCEEHLGYLDCWSDIHRFRTMIGAAHITH